MDFRQIHCLLLMLLLGAGMLSGVLTDDASVEDEGVSIDVDESVSDIELQNINYKSPEAAGPVLLADHFDDEDKFEETWVKSLAKKEGTDENIAKYDGVWTVEEPKRSVEKGNLGLVLKSKARHAAISSPLSKPFVFDDRPLIVQYEVIFQEGQECGGAYLKLLSKDSEHKDLKDFHDKTPYSIMFGPDKCGNDHKLHFIFRHKNPLNGSIEEKHAKKPKERLEDFFKDKQPHLYTLILRPDNTFVIKVDGLVVNEGSLLDDFTPPVNPPLEIEDPMDKRPEDWDEREKIPDPTASKPQDWDEDAPAQIVDEDDKAPEGWLEDELATIPNPDAVKPEDWDEEMDGEWEPPEITNPKCAEAPGCGPYKKRMISNPNYKGKWLPPLITNPNYHGKWKPKLIHNPEYFNDEHPFKMTSIYAVGFELWSMSPDILFDNIIITDDELVAKKWAEDTFDLRKQRIAIDSSGYWQSIVNFTAQNPWIWSVYIFLLGIPVLLVLYCCCFGSKDTEEIAPQGSYETLIKDKGTKEVEEEVEEEPKENDESSEEVIDEKNDESNEESDGKKTLLNKKESPVSTNTEGTRRRKPKRET